MLTAGQIEKHPGVYEKYVDSGIWWISFTDADGKRRREKVGKKMAALDLRRDRLLQVARNEPIPQGHKRVWTFAKLANENIRFKSAKLRPLTIATNNSQLSMLLPIMGAIRIDRITPPRGEEILGQLAVGRSGSTVNRFRSFMSSCYTFGMKRNLVQSNPFTRVSRWPENAPRTRFLSDSEKERLVRVLKGDPVEHHEWEFRLALETGMRRGEQFHAKWADVHVDESFMDVFGKTRERHVRLNKDAKEALEKLRAITGEKEFIIPDANGGAVRDTRKWFRAALREANIRNFRWHDLRHTFASDRLRAGANPRQVQDLLGHSSLKMTEKYLHHSQEDLQRAVEKKGKR
jgi:site-specific recombinase XerD